MAAKRLDSRPKAERMRSERNRRLAQSDWTQVPDAPLTDTQRTAWAAYRQALRDMPQQVGFPADATWPQSP